MLAGKNNEEKIWNYLKSAGLNDFGTAGLMGNLYAESGLIPNNVENLYEKRLGVTDASYTAAVDSGKYQFFATDKAGYGLAQWTYCSRKAELLDYAQCCRKSIGDLEMQLDFLMKELREGYKAVLAVLKTAGSVRAASDAVLLKFERPADQSEAAQARRAAFGQKYYDKYAAGSAAGSGGKPMTEQEQRQKIVSIAQSYIGCKESDGSHRKIIDLYNSHKPLARLRREVHGRMVQHVRKRRRYRGGNDRHHPDGVRLRKAHRAVQEAGELAGGRRLCAEARRLYFLRLAGQRRGRLHRQRRSCGHRGKGQRDKHHRH